MGKKKKKNGFTEFDLTMEEQMRLLNDFSSFGDNNDDEDESSNVSSLINDDDISKLYQTDVENTSNDDEDEHENDYMVDEDSDDDDYIPSFTIILNKSTSTITFAGTHDDAASIRLDSIETFDNNIHGDVNIMEQMTDDLTDLIITSFEPCAVIPYELFNECIINVVSFVHEKFRLYEATKDGNRYILVYHVSDDNMDDLEDVYDRLICTNKFTMFVHSILTVLCENKYVRYDFNKYNLTINDETSHKYINAILNDIDTMFGSSTGMNKNQVTIKNLDSISFRYRGIIDKIAKRFNSSDENVSEQSDDESGNKEQNHESDNTDET